MEWLFESQTWIALITLTILEIILGIDNIVVISILAQKVPVSQQAKARTIGLGLALITRIIIAAQPVLAGRSDQTVVHPGSFENFHPGSHPDYRGLVFALEGHPGNPSCHGNT